MYKNGYFATGIDMLERKIAGLNFATIQSDMATLLDLAQGMSNIKGRETDRRGYLTLMDGISGVILFTIPYGEIPQIKWKQYFELSQEKATRLFLNVKKGHTSSHQSRNVELDRYGGAIYINCGSTVFILSFSGMPEDIDEAMMLVLGQKIAIDIKKRISTKIEALDRNLYWRDLQLKFNEYRFSQNKD